MPKKLGAGEEELWTSCFLHSVLTFFHHSCPPFTPSKDEFLLVEFFGLDNIRIDCFVVCTFLIQDLKSVLLQCGNEIWDNIKLYLNN